MDHKDLAQASIDQQRAHDITDGVKRVQDRIAQAASKAGCDPSQITLLAATKTRNVGEIMAALQAGIRTIGENRPQELTAKVDGLAAACAALGWQYGAVRTHVDDAMSQTALNSTHIDVHCIGQLQSNKINKVLPIVNTIESVDSVQLAQKIAKRVSMLEQPAAVGVLLEVNESGEESKSGCAPQQAEELAYEIARMDGIVLQGFMTIGAHVSDERVIRQGFAHLRGVRDAVLASGETGTAQAQTLSMGMSGDMAYAIEEGSTLVRVGTAIFGAREFI